MRIGNYNPKEGFLHILPAGGNPAYVFQDPLPMSRKTRSDARRELQRPKESAMHSKAARQTNGTARVLDSRAAIFAATATFTHVLK